MKIMLLGCDTPLGLALTRILEQQKRHDCVSLSLSESRFKSERLAKKWIKRVAGDCLVDLRLEATLDNREHLHELDIARTRWFGKACKRNDILYLCQSSAWVYSGHPGSAPYDENDLADNHDGTTLGMLLREAEAALFEMAPQFILLRLAPVFSSGGGTMLSKLLHRFARGEKTAMSDAQFFNPISADDAGRVMAGILDQLACGSLNRGVYHYGSNERASYFEFGEAIYAAASQFVDLDSGGVVRSSDGSQPQGDWTLSSQRLFDHFGIHQAPWRPLLAPAVKAFFQHQLKRK
jgi:dTDP-4-dehydrorhamnose reductase